MEQTIKVKVKKRDGKLEVYDPEKIKKVVIAAGLDEESAKKLVDSLNVWISGIKTNWIASIQIRDQVLVEIQKLDDYAAKKFSWWEKYKDKNSDSLL